jgi:ATP-binding cassette subfamily B protein
MDDSTSSVDVATEYRIQQALDKLMIGRTTFIIAQRISTVRDADAILVLDKGRIAAQGTHEDLMRESSIYAEIYSSQLQNECDLLPELCEEDVDLVSAEAAAGRTEAPRTMAKAAEEVA